MARITGVPLMNIAKLSSENRYTLFSFGGKEIRFRAPRGLNRYLRVKKWHDGYLEVETEYSTGIEEEYIDIRPVLRDLLIDQKEFLAPIEKVEVQYARATDS